MFICCLISYQHDIDSTVDLADAVVVVSGGTEKRNKQKTNKKKTRSRVSFGGLCSCRLRAV